jgi:hypothetical protein
MEENYYHSYEALKKSLNTKLKNFKNLITYKRKNKIKKTAIINIDTHSSDLFISETYDSIFTY